MAQCSALQRWRQVALAASAYAQALLLQQFCTYCVDKIVRKRQE